MSKVMNNQPIEKKTRDKTGCKAIFQESFAVYSVSKPRVMTVDKNPDYPIAIAQLKVDEVKVAVQRYIHFYNHQ
ncbi:hypothetical protein OH784_26275 [Ectobacillus funiculus]|uniref:hypothetical protein n=1 Tax=Ectobacillus funiculus TaxID=137993 RepID=UPI00397DC5EC